MILRKILNWGRVLEREKEKWKASFLMSERQGEIEGRDRRMRDREKQETGNTERDREEYWMKLLPLFTLYRVHFYNVYNGKWYILIEWLREWNVLSWSGTSIE